MHLNLLKFGFKKFLPVLLLWQQIHTNNDNKLLSEPKDKKSQTLLNQTTLPKKLNKFTSYLKRPSISNRVSKNKNTINKHDHRFFAQTFPWNLLFRIRTGRSNNQHIGISTVIDSNWETRLYKSYCFCNF